MKMYQQNRSPGEDLVLAHLSLVKRVALHLKARVPAFMDLDELIQVGMIGLLEATQTYDPSKGIDFDNFAHARVRGAMLDEVRRLSFLPRSAVAFNKEHNEKRAKIDRLIEILNVMDMDAVRYKESLEAVIQQFTEDERLRKICRYLFRT